MGWEAVAKEQQGLITRAQAVKCDLKPKQIERLVTRGTWVRVYPSVYRVAATENVWPSSLKAAQLWAGKDAVISHEAAAALWELDDFPRDTVELSGTARLIVPPGVTYHHVRRLPKADVTVKRHLWVTDVPRTLLDLAGTIDEVRFERAFDQALHWRLTTVEQLEWCLERNKAGGRDGGVLFKTLLANRKRYGALESPLESDFEGFRRRNGLPEAEHGHVVLESDRWIAKVDFAWPEQRVVVQTHGSRIHREEKTWQTDQGVQNQLQAHGWKVYTVTAQMLAKHSGPLLKLLKGALTPSQPTAAAPARFR